MRTKKGIRKEALLPALPMLAAGGYGLYHGLQHDKPYQGAVDKMMAPVFDTASSVLPAHWQGPFKSHYNKYSDLYNAGLIGLGGSALINSFGGSGGGGNNGGNGGGGFGTLASWLLPMAILGGGAYLLNRATKPKRSAWGAAKGLFKANPLVALSPVGHLTEDDWSWKSLIPVYGPANRMGKGLREAGYNLGIVD